jgi:hypothetical protein
MLIIVVISPNYEGFAFGLRPSGLQTLTDNLGIAQVLNLLLGAYWTKRQRQMPRCVCTINPEDEVNILHCSVTPFTVWFLAPRTRGGQQIRD